MAAQDAQLLLKVGLDLSTFRNQLATLGKAATGYSLPVNVHFDRTSVQNELNALGKNISRRTYRLNIETNLSAEIKKARDLADALRNIPKGGGAQGGAGVVEAGFSQAALRRLKDDIKPLYKAAAQAGLVVYNEEIANNVKNIAQKLSQVGKDSIAGLLNGLKSGDAKLKAVAKQLGQALVSSIKSDLGIQSPSKVFRDIGDDVGKGFELGAVASMDRAFDALEQKLQARLKKLQSILSLAPSRRSAFPFIATGGGLESGPIAREIDQAYAQISQIQGRRQGRLSFERGALAQSAGRLLPPARDRSLAAARETILPGGGAVEQVSRRFIQSLRDTQDVLSRNFSANTYLPKATRNLAVSMDVAAKQLMGTKIAGLLPSKEMMEPLRFSRAMQQAARIDKENASRYALQQQEQQRSAVFGPASVLGGQRFQAPNIAAKAGTNVPEIMAGTKPIADRLRAAAVQYAQNAPAVIKYLNLFSTAGGVNIADLPGPNESPGQYIRRIQQSLQTTLRQGGFGAGTVPQNMSRDYFQPGRGPQLPGSPLQLALPPAGGTGGTSDRVRGVGQPPERGGALALAGGPSTRLPEGYFENARKYNAALDIARATSAKFTASQIPLIGGLKEVAGEFGFAIKQVLLFGTAYKGLAFVTSLPGQILNAAKSQQQYNNALQTATQDTGTFAKELLYVDNVQRAFGLNLETTRTGFTRLYASMAPTGFDSGSIEKLFTGISAATAALQLTPDKAERVIYAFGQMASKGQIMSEELKGQLGDVLPGALAIFAKAAGMSVKEFSKAMEDGVFVGGKFREVFAKVSDELMTRFGTGAQAAGKSLQGLLNTVGGDFQRTLESFAPLANIAAQAVLGPLGNALRQLSTSAQIAMGEMERVQGQLGAARQDVSSLREGGASAGQIRAAEQNVAALEARYRSLNEALKDPAVAKQVKDLQLLVQELSKAGTFVMNVAKTIGSMLAPALNFLGTNLTSVIATITAFYVGFQAARVAAMTLMGVLLLYRGLSALLGFGAAAQQATALAGAFNVLGVAATRTTTQMVGLRLALTALVASTVIGAVVGGIVMIAGAFATMSDKAKDAAQSSRDAAQAAIDAAQAGNVAGAAMSVQTVLTESRKAAAARKALEGIYARATLKQKGGVAPMAITSQESVALRGTELTSGMIQAKLLPGNVRQIRVPSGPEMRTLRGQFGSLAGQQAISLREAKEAERQAEEVNKRLGLNKPMPGPATSDAAESAKPTRAAARAAERAAQQARELKATLQQLREQLDIEKRSLELQEAISFARADGNEKLVAFLQTQEKFYDIDEKSSKLQKDLAAGKIKQAEFDLRQQRLAIEQKNVEITEEERLNAILRERYGITSEVLDVARRARENAFSMGLGGAGTFRTDLNLMPKLTGDQLGGKLDQVKKDLAELLNTANQVVSAAAAIGGAFGDSFKGVASGAMTAQQALANFFQSVGDYFLDMAAKMIAKWMEIQLIQGLGNFIGGLFGGGASSVFGAGGAPNYSGAFGASGPAFQPNLFDSAGGGVTPFAGGGLVTGPTMALMGEGRFNEAIVPLPNGKSIPVELGGAAGNQIVSNITVNVNNGQMQSNGGANSTELTRKLEGAVKQVIIGELRPGGVLSNRG